MNVVDRYPARYFDGRTSRPQNVAIALTAEGIAIYRQSGILLATWSAGNIVLVEPPRDDEPARIGLEGTTARLVVNDAEVVARLMEVAPGANRRIRTSRRAILKVGAWTGLAVAAVALIVLVLIPLLSAQLASRVPETVKRQIGDATLEQIVQIMPRLPDEQDKVRYCTGSEGLTALRVLGGRLLAGADMDSNVRLVVVDANLVNAFALPGGLVVLTDGLLQAAETPEEVAGVLAHELGHVAYAHPTQAIFRTTAVSLLISAVIGDFTGGVLIAGVAEWALNSAYTRDAEREADRFSIARMNAAGIDGRGLLRFFERLRKEESKGSESSLYRMISTHPPTPERMAYIRANATGTGEAMPARAWADVKSTCRRVSEAPPRG